ncbi:MAG: DUF4383 domain-containing protein [Candidatus Paceibacterota bacterium]
MSKIQKWGLVYAVMFALVVGLDFIPAFKDPDGYLFGIFALDTYDNALHAFSGLWALTAALISTKQSIWYFKIFGSFYLLDGLVGLVLGNAFLDFGLFLYGIADYGLLFNFFANIPHILIGGVAVWVGFYLSKKSSHPSASN